ncbi:MAG: long-chain-fatty-acid--CoA ligase [Alphaproteobacteria bacterium]|nr:long-chain-fatty-acid--CoA ligase [Alphaproteobacteria bacterium]
MLGRLVIRNWKLRADHPAVLFEGRTITHGALAERSFRLANALLGRGVRRGDQVAILAQNCPEYMEVFAAGELGGWATVTVNYRLAAPEVDYVLEDSQPKVLVLDPQFAGSVSPRARARLEQVLILGGDEGDEGYERLLASGEPLPPAVEPQPEDCAYVVYTSGTTGRPKGVMLSHRGELQAAQINALVSSIDPRDRCAVTMPLYHIGGKITLLSHSLHGCPIILHRAFRPEAFFESLRSLAVTKTLLAPTMLKDLMDACPCNPTTLPDLRKLLYSAAPMPETILRRGMEAFGPIFLQFYGMTESGGPGCALLPHQHVLDGPKKAVRRLRSAGQPAIGCEVRIVGPDGSECEIEQPGEILIRNPCLMMGYLNNDAATRETLRDGWLHTGDIGTVDEEGFVFVVDRLKDMIVSGGENIYSREVEDALMRHPAVAEAAVVGRADERWGESVFAFVTLASGKTASEEELGAHCRQVIAPYKRPRGFSFVDNLPRLPNGKIEKTKLRQRLAAISDSSEANKG